MINKKVVVFQIEDMLSNINKENLLSFGGHIDNGAAFLELMTNVLTLLKEQEAKQVIKQTYHVMMNRDYENPVEVTRYDWLCPACKSLLCRDIDVIDDNYHFCKVCGQAVKWE